MLKNSRLALWFILASAPMTANAADVKIKSVTLDPMSNVHLCKALGGQGKDPRLTIKHDKAGGAKIKIKMYDNVSNGNTVNHYSTTVSSNASGVTSVSYNFLPPCNRTGNSVSNYKFSVQSGRSKKTIKWGRYDSIKKKIVR